MLSVAEAREKLLDVFSLVGTEILPISQAMGRVITNNVISSIDLPGFNNSSMDGFAVRSNDVQDASHDNPITLSIIADVPAGKVMNSLINSGEAARIMTGAVLPPGADAVVPIEDTDHYERFNNNDAKYPNLVDIFQPTLPGKFIRPIGQDVKKGEIIFRAGIRLRPQDIGYLAMLGIPKVSVYRKPQVAIISTGDELIPVGVSLEPGKIYDSNAYTLSALISREGGNPIYLGIAVDKETAIQELFERAISLNVDLVLSSAGVSVGAFDYVRKIIEQYGELSFWRVNMRPGKPFLFGHYHQTPFVGLPGNPVSAYVGYEVFVRPAILKMVGIKELYRPVIRVQLLENVESDGRESYLRAIVRSQNEGWVAKLTGHQGSGNLYSLVQANALLIIPSGVKSLPIGCEVDAWLLDEIHEQRSNH
jgi:molybdopterin molybdotransferase